MVLAQQFCPPVQFFNHIESAKRYFHFEDRDKSILSVFWLLVNAIEKNDSICLVVENQKDAEHLNYLISKYSLAELCLILSSNTPEVNSHTLGKIKDAKDSKFDLVSSDNLYILNDYLLLLKSVEKNLSILRTDQLNNKSTIQLIDKLNNYSVNKISDKKITPSFSASIVNYTDQKEKLIQAENLYQNSFSFLNIDFPFSEKVIKDYSQAQLIEVLDNYLDQLDTFLGSFEKIESQLFQAIKLEYNQANHRAKQEINIIDSLLTSAEHQSTDTVNLKINHHFSKLLQYAVTGESKNSNFDVAYFNELKHEIYENKHHHQECLTTNYQNELERIHNHTQFGEVSLKLLEETDLWINQIKEAGVFKDFKFGKSATFNFQKNLLKDIRLHISSALHFMDNNENYYAWRIFLESLNKEDVEIINYLSLVSSNWRLDYDRLFVQQLIDQMFYQLDSPSIHLAQLQENLEEFQILHMAKLKSEIIKSSGFEEIEELDWDNLINQHSKELSKRFPIMVIGLNVFSSNKEAIQKGYSKSVFLNCKTDNIKDFDQERNVFVFSEEKMLKSVKNRLKISSNQIIKVQGPSAIINRPLSQLNRSELNRSSMHLANELNQIGASHRIFQLKNVSIISFWSNTKNTKLVSTLNKKGIKEIISNLDQNKLLPALFSNPDDSIYVLIEDGLIINTDKIEILRQLYLLNQLKQAGIHIINVDNLDNHPDIDKEIQKIEYKTQSSDLVVETN